MIVSRRRLFGFGAALLAAPAIAKAASLMPVSVYDDAILIQRLLEKAHADWLWNGSGRVVLPARTFNLHSTITMPPGVYFEGGGSRLVAHVPNSTMIEACHAPYATITKHHFDGNGLEGITAIDVGGAVSLESVYWDAVFASFSEVQE